MSAWITAFHHVNITVTPANEEAAKQFYGEALGLKEVPKPEASRGRGGAWYQLGPVQLHLSLEKGVENEGAKRHFCLLVADLEKTEQHLRKAGVQIFPDDQPVPGCSRFYVRDPGGNRIEIAQDLSSRSNTDP
jgi:catechol 2,3-dioxygenase-like lactoylglutathione lyase family enzyme